MGGISAIRSRPTTLIWQRPTHLCAPSASSVIIGFGVSRSTGRRAQTWMLLHWRCAGYSAECRLQRGSLIWAVASIGAVDVTASSLTASLDAASAERCWRELLMYPRLCGL